MTTSSSDVLVRQLHDYLCPIEHQCGGGSVDDECVSCAAAEKIETLEAHLAMVRDRRGAREQVLERRIGHLEEAFSRVSDEGDVLSADLTRAREERDAKERARLAQMEADRTGKTTSFVGSDGYRYIVDPQPEVTRAREERDFAAKQIQAEIEVRWHMAEQMRALREALGQAVSELAKRGVQVAPEVKAILSGSTSTETSPAREGMPK